MTKQFIKPPFLTTSFSEEGKTARKRFENILSLRVKRLGAGLMAAAALGLVSAGSLVACGTEEVSKPQGAAETEAKEAATIGEAVAAAILEGNAGIDCEFYGEGHSILGIEGITDDNGGNSGEVKVYAITSFGGYRFMNGMFIEDCGSGATPAVFVFKSEDGEWKLVSSQYPQDGSYCAESIKEMFPVTLRSKALNSSVYHEELKSQEHAQAKAYLESIGREASVGSYSDLNAELPVMNVVASNKLLDLDKYDVSWKYPMYLGNCEYIEDGARYTYETVWDGDESGGVMRYTKYDSGGNAVEKHIFMVDGENVTRLE